MKKYKFTIKKELKNDIEINAENRNDALIKVIEMLGIGDDFVFKNSKENEQFYEIKLNKIIDYKDKKIHKNNEYDKEKIEEFLKQINKNSNENIEETEDDFPIEYDEIVCDKCGNCIILD